MKFSKDSDICQPVYLRLLDEDPKQVSEGIYYELEALFSVNPPPPYKTLNKEDKEDIRHDILLHCTNDNFKVLRKYRNVGKPFQAWLYSVCYNYILDFMRSKKNYEVDIDSKSKISGIEKIYKELGINPHQTDVFSELVAATLEAMKKLDKFCRVLLEMAADEYTFKEMLPAIGWTKDKMKSLYSKLRHCRKKLRDLLSLAGYDLSI